jgi:hypothetical protein
MIYQQIMCTPILVLIDIPSNFIRLEYYRNLPIDHKFVLYQMYYQLLFFLNCASVQIADILALTACFHTTDITHIFPFSHKTPAMFVF